MHHLWRRKPRCMHTRCMCLLLAYTAAVTEHCQSLLSLLTILCLQLQKRGEEAAQLEMAQSAAAAAEAAADAVKQEATQQTTTVAAPPVAAAPAGTAAAANSSTGATATGTGTAATGSSGSRGSDSSSGPKELQRCALHLSLGDTLAEMLAQRQKYVVYTALTLYSCHFHSSE
jgi:hypothetical protein